MLTIHNSLTNIFVFHKLVQICRAIKNINNVLGLNGRLEPFIRCGGAPIPSTVCIWSPIRGREKDTKITFRRISGKKPNKGDNL